MHNLQKRNFAYALPFLAGAMVLGLMYMLYIKRTQKPVPTEDDPQPLSRNIPADDDASLETKIGHAVQAMEQVNDETKQSDVT